MATVVKNGDTIKANGDYAVEGVMTGRRYQFGLLYRSGSGTMDSMGFSEGESGTVNSLFDTDGTTALTVTATTPRAYEVRAVGDTLRFSISSASALNAKLICSPIQHGY